MYIKDISQAEVGRTKTGDDMSYSPPNPLLILESFMSVLDDAVRYEGLLNSHSPEFHHFSAFSGPSRHFQSTFFHLLNNRDIANDI